jgi:hypothetical protein
MRLWIASTAFLLASLAAGCGKPKLEVVIAPFEVPGEGKLYTVEPTRREQEIQVTGSATGAPVNVYIYLDKNRTAAETQIISNKLTPLILQKQENAEAINLAATIPANETAVVHVRRVSFNKPATVQLKITNH